MSASLKAAFRLVGALEDFADRQDRYLESADYASAASTNDRARPLVVHLSQLARDEAVRVAVAERIRALASRRAASLSLIGARLAEIKAERARVAEATRRLQVLGPAYGVKRRSRRLNAAA
jgi:hypothetical protein